jgi:hypothetical protein
MNDLRNPYESGEEATLELLKTKLRILGDELQRLNQDRGVLLRLPLASIESIDFARHFDPFSLVFVAVGAGLAAIGYLVSESNVLTCILYVAGAVLAGFGLLGTMSDRIHIRTRDGTTVVVCSDMRDECECFVTSVRHLLGMRR